MAGFNTHITTSTVVGIGYGSIAWAVFNVNPVTCMLSAGLCSVAGILPDLDSSSGKPVKETTSVIAAIVPLLMIDRWTKLGLSPESMALAGVLCYIVMRFGVAEFFKRYTKHRGMWHSVPAAISAALFAFLVVSGTEIEIRLFKAAAVFVGFMTHLVLDEIWSVERNGVRVRLKKSFGTAIKFWNHRSMWSNISTYAKLIILIAAAVGDPLLMEHFGYHQGNELQQIATEQIGTWFR
ncbi:MAG: metal-dependent hydrolase [Blastopirellula sp.]|nr:MAG: metal-dependent hydrolase [Blastopirellula sp.]